jgi:hypothetical protein
MKYPKLWNKSLNKFSGVIRHLIFTRTSSRYILNKHMCPAHSLCYYHGHSAELGASRIVHGVLSGEWGILMNIYVLTVAEAPFHFYWDEPNECLWISFACVGIYILSGCFFLQTRPRWRFSSSPISTWVRSKRGMMYFYRAKWGPTPSPNQTRSRGTTG